ncbi:MAG TPA: LamG domain-containing protein [Chthoniobacterales bacterium]|nr:LamG domain-containing protein [Chthoniobacterales bacterium]
MSLPELGTTTEDDGVIQAVKPDNVSWLSKGGAWIRANKIPFILTSVLGLIAWVPLYGILFPPLVDLPEHILISKLLWEKLTGVSHLDLEISWILGYRLFPIFMMIVIPWFKLLGISFVFLPRTVAMALLAIHVIAVVAVLFSPLKNKSWKSCVLAACLALPAIVCMYSACWFIGFVNYTLAITLLVPAVFLTERFLNSGKPIDAFWIFLNLLFVYAAHPFGLAFWVMWCVSRGLAGIVTKAVSFEWKKLIALGLVFAPIVLYHSLATRNTSLAPSSHSLLTQSPVVSVGDWYHNRIRPLFDGTLLKPDDAVDSRLFARFAIGLILFTAVFVFRATKESRLRKMMLSGVFLIFIASWVNEKLIPVPGGAWLAYDYRFSSTVCAIGLALAGMVLIRLLPAATDKLRYKALFVALAVLSVSASALHLAQVRKSYKRYDAQARRYMAKVFKHEQPAGISLPHSRWHPDGTLIKLYVCLEQPDCNPPGTTFHTGYVKELYPVKFKSAARVLSRREVAAWRQHPPAGPLVGHWQLDEANASDVCVDSSGNGYAGKAKGTMVVDGKIGKARSFSGRFDSIEIPAINIPSAVTVTAWVYSDKFIHNGFVVAKNPVNSQWALFFESDGYLKWRGGGPEKEVRCPPPSNQSWHHIAATQEGTTARLYVDGILCATATVPAVGNETGSITIGRFDGGKFYYFNGRIDDVRIYNRALSDPEISQLFTGSQGPQ